MLKALDNRWLTKNSVQESRRTPNKKWRYKLLSMDFGTEDYRAWGCSLK